MRRAPTPSPGSSRCARKQPPLRRVAFHRRSSGPDGMDSSERSGWSPHERSGRRDPRTPVRARLPVPVRPQALPRLRRGGRRPPRHPLSRPLPSVDRRLRRGLPRPAQPLRLPAAGHRHLRPRLRPPGVRGNGRPLRLRPLQGGRAALPDGARDGRILRRYPHPPRGVPGRRPDRTARTGIQRMDRKTSPGAPTVDRNEGGCGAGVPAGRGDVPGADGSGVAGDRAGPLAVPVTKKAGGLCPPARGSRKALVGPDRYPEETGYFFSAGFAAGAALSAAGAAFFAFFAFFSTFFSAAGAALSAAGDAFFTAGAPFSAAGAAALSAATAKPAIENANATAIITAKIFFIRFPSKENI